MTYDTDLCNAMCLKYARWFFAAIKSGDCFANFYLREHVRWAERREAGGVK